jgi:hypothetical protein
MLDRDAVDSDDGPELFGDNATMTTGYSRSRANWPSKPRNSPPHKSSPAPNRDDSAQESAKWNRPRLHNFSCLNPCGSCRYFGFVVKTVGDESPVARNRKLLLRGGRIMFDFVVTLFLFFCEHKHSTATVLD